MHVSNKKFGEVKRIHIYKCFVFPCFSAEYIDTKHKMDAGGFDGIDLNIPFVDENPGGSHGEEAPNVTGPYGVGIDVNMETAASMQTGGLRGQDRPCQVPKAAAMVKSNQPQKVLPPKHHTLACYLTHRRLHCYTTTGMPSMLVFQ